MLFSPFTIFSKLCVCTDLYFALEILFCFALLLFRKGNKNENERKIHKTVFNAVKQKQTKEDIRIGTESYLKHSICVAILIDVVWFFVRMHANYWMVSVVAINGINV